MGKVLLINGSPNERGCTYTALCEVQGALERRGVATSCFSWAEAGARLHRLRPLFRYRPLRV